jgi:hypothetical protein
VIRHAIAFVVLSVLVPPVAAQKESMSMSTPPRADAPLQIVRTLFSDTRLTVLLANVSGRTVEQTTMGLVLGDGASVVQPVTRIGSACIATVPPDGLLVVTAAHNGFDKADSYFRAKGIIEKQATIGLTRVRFADGTEWTYPLEANGRFDEKTDQAVADKAHALKEKHFPEKDMSWAFPGSGQEGKVSTCRK